MRDAITQEAINSIRDTGTALKERGLQIYYASVELDLRGLCGNQGDQFLDGMESEYVDLLFNYYQRTAKPHP